MLQTAMAFESLLSILRKTRESHPSFSARLAEAEALGRWPIAVGETIAKHARAIRVKNSVLWVAVEHPIWRAELHYRKHQILDILNGRVPSVHSSFSVPKDILVDIYYIDSKEPLPLMPKNLIGDEKQEDQTHQ